MSEIYKQLNDSAPSPTPPEGGGGPAGARAGRQASRTDAAAGSQVAPFKRQLDATRRRLETTRQKLNDARDEKRKAGQEQRRQVQELRKALTEATRQAQQSAARIEEIQDALNAQAKQQARAQRESAAAAQRLQTRIKTLEDEAENANRLLDAARREIDKQKASRAATVAAAPPAADAAERERLQRELGERLQAAYDRQLADYEQTIVADRDRLRRELVETTAAVARLEADVAEHRLRADTLDEQQRLLAELTPQPEWYLRLDDGSLYGPVTESLLLDWATACRIGPDHEVSTDREHWQPARQLPALHMEWFVELDGGNRFGPLNLAALASLVADGSIPAAARIVHASADTRFEAAVLALPVVGAMQTIQGELRNALTESRRRARRLEQSLAAVAADTTPAAPPKFMRARVLEHTRKPG